MGIHYYIQTSFCMHHQLHPNNTTIGSRSDVRTEGLRWVQVTTDIGIKLKFETSAKERDQKLLNFITMEILKIEQQHPSIQDIITIPMTPIINSSFNKHHIS